MIFEFSFGIGGKLGNAIENSIFRSADRKEELNKIRHDVEVARLHRELRIVNRLREEETMVEPDAGNVTSLYKWLDVMYSTSNGNVVAEALIGYYGGRDNIPSCYIGMSVTDTVKFFIDNESGCTVRADGYIQLFNDLKIVN